MEARTTTEPRHRNSKHKDARVTMGTTPRQTRQVTQRRGSHRERPGDGRRAQGEKTRMQQFEEKQPEQQKKTSTKRSGEYVALGTRPNGMTY